MMSELVAGNGHKPIVGHSWIPGQSPVHMDCPGVFLAIRKRIYRGIFPAPVDVKLTTLPLHFRCELGVNPSQNVIELIL